MMMSLLPPCTRLPLPSRRCRAAFMPVTPDARHVAMLRCSYAMLPLSAAKPDAASAAARARTRARRREALRRREREKYIHTQATIADGASAIACSAITIKIRGPHEAFSPAEDR